MRQSKKIIMNSFNDLRVWAVYDKFAHRLEFVSESRSECDNIRGYLERSPLIRQLVIIRFDLSPLYYERYSNNNTQKEK